MAVLSSPFAARYLLDKADVIRKPTREFSQMAESRRLTSTDNEDIVKDDRLPLQMWIDNLESGTEGSSTPVPTVDSARPCS